jgi:two-component system, NarL family, nitrate/nitrite response regulator NarL
MPAHVNEVTSDCATPITILVADDHSLFREALRTLLETDPALKVVGEAGDGKEAVRRTQELRPDIVLLDLVMPAGSGLDTLRELSAVAPASRVLLMSAEAHNNEVLEALTLGARGVVMKHSTTAMLFKCIRTVMAGGHWIGRECVDEVIDRMRERAAAGPPPRRPTFGLSPRELQVVATIVAGYTNEDIAGELRISVKTVKHHLTSIFDKLGMSNRLELALFAVQHRLAIEPVLRESAEACEPHATMVA